MVIFKCLNCGNYIGIDPKGILIHFQLNIDGEIEESNGQCKKALLSIADVNSFHRMNTNIKILED